MASILLVGFIDCVKYLPNDGGCFVFVSEFKKGYRHKDGTVEDDKYLQWKCVFKPYFKKYISSHFNNGMLVEIKGEVLPYQVSQGTVMDGYSVLGQTCNLFSFPRSAVKNEVRMMRESQSSSDETPDLDNYMKPDF